MAKQTYVVSRDFVRTRGKLGTPERTSYRTRVDVEIEIDMATLAESLGWKALINKSGKSRALGGAIIVRAKNQRIV
jgi:hypothetical protein